MYNIVTPTYNRAHTLNRVYDSLIHQTEKRFTWIIIDDCSNDNTEELVKNWIQEKNIAIDYHKLSKNQGKPIAVNFGLTKCQHTYTIIADSDDSFSYNTLSDLTILWDFINKSNNNIGAVWTLVTDENNNIKGDLFPKDFWQVNFKQRILDVNKSIQGDKWHCWKTEVLKNNPLYTKENCHIGESHTWNKINREYDFLCLNTAYLKAFFTDGSLINSKKSNKDIAIGYYYSSYYALKDVSISQIIKYKYYRYLAFEYIKSKFYYNDKSIKLSNTKSVICLVLFVFISPKRLLNKAL